MDNFHAAQKIFWDHLKSVSDDRINEQLLSECGRDTKNYSNNVSTLLDLQRSVPTNPLPESYSNHSIGRRMSNCFITKDNKNRSQLTDCDRYHPNGQGGLAFKAFQPILEETVRKFRKSLWILNLQHIKVIPLQRHC